MHSSTPANYKIHKENSATKRTEKKEHENNVKNKEQTVQIIYFLLLCFLVLNTNFDYSWVKLLRVDSSKNLLPLFLVVQESSYAVKRQK